MYRAFNKIMMRLTLHALRLLQTSMLQCAPMADSCLALGAASCRRARELVTQYAAEGTLSLTPCLHSGSH